MTESGIWTSLSSGDIRALHELYESHVQDLYQYGIVLTHDPDKVHDCIHDLFVTIWNSRERLSTPESTKAYLLVSLRRRLFDKGSKISSLTENIEEGIESMEFSPGHEEVLIQREEEAGQQQRLASAMSRLSDRQREIIHMKYYQQLEYDEIGRIMDLNYQSARNLVTRALAALRKEMLLTVIIILMLV